jgi:hypothetical protein
MTSFVDQQPGASEPSPEWIAFFRECRRLAALARERRATNERLNADAPQPEGSVAGPTVQLGNIHE